MIHTNLSIEAQANEVARVKKFKAGDLDSRLIWRPKQPFRSRFQLYLGRFGTCWVDFWTEKAGFIIDPVCVPPTMTLEELDSLKSKLGFTGFPVTENGKMGNKLLGLVTKRDTATWS